MSLPAVFLDRDGVINENRDDYVKSWDEFVLVPGALAALQRLAQSRYLIVVATNQSAVNRGLITRAQLDDIHRRMRDAIQAAGGRLDGVYYCPHTPAEGCACRKPQPGLFFSAAADLGIDLTASYSIGDKVSDLEAGHRSSCQALLVLTGKGAQQDPTAVSQYPVAKDLDEAVDCILAGDPAAQMAASV